MENNFYKNEITAGEVPCLWYYYAENGHRYEIIEESTTSNISYVIISKIDGKVTELKTLAYWYEVLDFLETLN